MTDLEKDVELYLRRKVESLGGLCLKWVSPGNSGVPDRIILMPAGRIAFVELNRPKGGRVGRLQDYWRMLLDSLGFEAHVIDSRTGVDWLIKRLEDELGADIRQPARGQQGERPGVPAEICSKKG